MVKYQIKIYYRTEVMDKVTGYMQRIFDDWKKTDKKLIACRVYEFETDTPLPPETIEAIRAIKEDWMEEVVVEEIVTEEVPA